MGTAANKRDATRNINCAVDAVAGRLGNTRTVCRKYYVHPALLEAYLQGLTAGPSVSASPRKARRKRRVAALRRDEVAILQFSPRFGITNPLDGLKYLGIQKIPSWEGCPGGTGLVDITYPNKTMPPAAQLFLPRPRKVGQKKGAA